MTFEELYDDLYRKYGDEFNWEFVRFTDKFFVKELKSEISENHPLRRVKWAVAIINSQCTTNR